MPKKKSTGVTSLLQHSHAPYVLAMVVVALISGTLTYMFRQPQFSEAATVPFTADQCLARPTTQITRLTGNLSGQFRNDSTVDHTVDARGMVKRDAPVPTRYPNITGVSSSQANGTRTCWIGGAVFGNIPWNLGWSDWYENQGSTYDGDGLIIGSASDWDVVDGLRMDNVSDALSPYGKAPAQSVFRNLYFTNIRDDCLEIDQLPRTTTILDSYMECYSGISEEPDGTPAPTPGTVTTVDNVVMWLKPQTSTSCRYAAACADGNGAYTIFKMRGSQTPVYTVKNSVFRIDEPSEWGANDHQFHNVKFENSKLVWTGQSKWGNFPTALPAGLTLTTDVNVFNAARADWLSRHGCPAAGDTTGTSCTRMINPTPPGTTTPPPPTGDTVVPSVSISSPGNLQDVSGTVTVNATASDNVGVTKVEFLADSTLVNTDTSSPYSYGWNSLSLPNGQHRLTAKAYDAAGNNASATVTVNVNNVTTPPPTSGAPTVNWLTPASGSTLSGIVYMDAGASDNGSINRVEYFIDGAYSNSEASPPYDWNWNTSGYSNGAHAITAKAYDNEGNIATSVLNVTVNNGGSTATGLSATYYDNMDFTGTTMQRVDQTVNLNLGYAPPSGTIGADTFSVRWTGRIVPTTSQTYRFCTRSDDGVRLWIGGTQLINNWTNHAVTENCATKWLNKGQSYTVRMDFFENGGHAVAQLFYSTSTIPKQIVPAGVLRPN